MRPFGAGPSSLAEVVPGIKTAIVTVAIALNAPWNSDGSQIQPDFS